MAKVAFDSRTPPPETLSLRMSNTLILILGSAILFLMPISVRHWITKEVGLVSKIVGLELEHVLLCLLLMGAVGAF
ncbi:MAG: hypothetical protein ACJAXW_003053 [Candidatus Azotimanducaceae bacterium]|jgi:hypothetical protein